MLKLILYLFIILVIAYDCHTSFYKNKPYGHYDGVGLCKDEFFYVSYSEYMVNPDYTAFHLTYDHMKELQGGRKSFILDNQLKQMHIVQANPNSKTFNISMNRGHLTPSYAMSWNKTTDGPWYYSYMMSNIAPQNYKLNQGLWAKLEMNEVNFILKNKVDAYIVTGVSYNSRHAPVRSFDNITIPDYFFNAICDPINMQSAAFFVTNDEKTSINFLTVAYVEQLLGIKLFDGCNNNMVNSSHWWSYSDFYDDYS